MRGVRLLPMRAALQLADDCLASGLHSAMRRATARCLPIAFQLKAARKAAAQDYSL
jgi:hypothetical protein